MWGRHNKTRRALESLVIEDHNDTSPTSEDLTKAIDDTRDQNATLDGVEDAVARALAVSDEPAQTRNDTILLDDHLLENYIASMTNSLAELIKIAADHQATMAKRKSEYEAQRAYDEEVLRQMNVTINAAEGNVRALSAGIEDQGAAADGSEGQPKKSGRKRNQSAQEDPVEALIL